MYSKDDLIFYILDDNKGYYIPEFESQEEIEEFFGEPVSFTIGECVRDPAYFWTHIGVWEFKHKFEIVQKSERIYNKDEGTVEITVIYTLDDKYYSVTYIYDVLTSENEFDNPPKEVVPVEEKVIKFIDKK